MELNEDQHFALCKAVSGHNLFIDGDAGTGKTYLVKKVFQSLSKAGKNVAITCTTGIACMNYDPTFGASTIHRWSGLHDGRYNSTEVLDIVRGNEDTKDRILSTDTLILDEISMLSLKLFEQLHNICCIKDQDKPWGGIQVIVSGDFNQLRPTPNREYNDDGEFCFKSPYFEALHKVTLNQVIRQNNEEFISMIQSVSTGGIMSQELINEIKLLERPFAKDKEDSVKLFARNDMVNSYNRKRLTSQPGNVFEYRSNDSGDQSKLQNIRAQQVLWLKEGCPVILNRNLSQLLVNGLQGTVLRCEPDGPTVHFPAIDVTVKVKKTNFSVFSAKANRTVANREQVPLQLAYALTIHKAQGMTLDSVEVDCKHIFQPGQLGVAIGRVCSKKDLRVINFNPKVCFPQSQEVQLLKLQRPHVFHDDLSCCRDTDRAETAESVAEFWFEDSDVLGNEGETEDTFDEEFDEIISALDFGDSSVDFQIPADFDICKIIKDCILESPVTQLQTEMNQIASNIIEGNLHSVKKFCKQQFENFSEIVNGIGVSEDVPVKAEKLNEFYAKCHTYQTSDNYKLSCQLFLQELLPASHAHSHICTKITSSIRLYLLNEKAKLFDVSERHISSRQMTEASKARIRYVGGYCIHEVKKKYTALQRSCLYSTSVDGQRTFETAEERLNILNTFIEREDVLRETTDDPQSLIDIKRRQYLSRGLLNITDEMFRFFYHTCELCSRCLNDKSVNVHGEQLHSFCRSELLKNKDLQEEFVGIISRNKQHYDEFSTYSTLQTHEAVVISVIQETVSYVQHANDLVNDIIGKFLMVMLNQFRRDLLESFAIDKTMAHRKQIQTRKKKQSIKIKSLTFETIQKDITPKKEMSHSLMKGLLLSSTDCLTSMTKKQICALCIAYNVKVKTAKKKAELVNQLKEAILKSDSMVNYTILEDTGDVADMPASSHQEPGSSTCGMGDIPLERDLSTSVGATITTEPEADSSPSGRASSSSQPEPGPHTSGRASSSSQPEPGPHTSGRASGSSQPEPGPHTSGRASSSSQPEPGPHTSGRASSFSQPEPGPHTSGRALSSTELQMVEEVMEQDELDSELCWKCKKTGKEGVQWIQCSSCRKWYHRNCAGLRLKKHWQTASAQGDCNVICENCLMEGQTS